MLKINKKVEYALMALKYMAQKDEGSLTSAREICEKFNIPFDTTAKVLQIMNNKNILVSTKGLKGGYTLAKSLDQINFIDIVEMVEGIETEMYCQNQKGLCDLYHSCNIVTPIDQLNRKVHTYLESLTLSELLLEKKDSLSTLGERI
ncbi:MAG: hypothetical protein Fur0010_16230 [Bdellovibrio sp.]